MTGGAAPRLYQQAVDILASRIAGGAIPPRTVLLESAVAAQFGFSRAPARQALAALERRGLVEKAEGRGYVVRDAATIAAPPEAAEDEPIRLLPVATWERIYREVEDELIARIAFASWRINEAELARHYGVSRTVAREVAGRLQQRGVLIKDERSRWLAPALTPDHVEELYELRAILEPVALRKAAPAVPAGFVAGMRRNLLAAIAEGGRVPGETLDALEEEMHVRLLGHAGNRALMQAIAQPQSLLVAHRFLYRWTARLFDVEPFLAEHLAIADHLAAGRIEDAARALADHLAVSSGRATARVDAIAATTEPDPLPYLDRLPARRG